MSETKWTPGPWTVFKPDGCERPGIEASNTTVVLFGDEMDKSDGAGVRGDTESEIAANARLISAAPDLAAALDSVLSDVQFMIERDIIPDVMGDILYVRARAALRKAKGETT